MIMKVALALLVLGSGSTAVSAHQPKSARCELCGTWILVDRIDRSANGDIVPEPGLESAPSGLLVYDGAGNVSAQVMQRVPPSVSAATQTPQPVISNNSANWGGYVAYFGKYEIDRAKHTVLHHVVGAPAIGDVGKTFRREYELSGDNLSLSFDTKSNSGTPVRRTLRWHRSA